MRPARRRRRAFLACAAALLAAACGSSTGTPTGPDIAWKGGRVRVYDYGDPTIRSDFKVEWGPAGRPRRILCETGLHPVALNLDAEGRLVVRYEEPQGLDTLYVTFLFASPDNPPEVKKEIR